MLTNKKFLEICRSNKESGPLTHDERLAMKVAKCYLRHVNFMFKNAAKRHDINFSHSVSYGSIAARMKNMKIAHRVRAYHSFHEKVMNAIQTIAEKHGYITEMRKTIANLDEPYLIISPNFAQEVA